MWVSIDASCNSSVESSAGTKAAMDYFQSSNKKLQSRVFFFFFLYSFCSPLLCSLGLFKVLSHFTIDQILNLNSFDTHGNANGDGSGTIGLLQFIGKVENIQYLRKALYAKIVSILIWTRFPSCDLICLVDRSPRIICSDTKSMYVSWEQSNTNIIAL